MIKIIFENRRLLTELKLEQVMLRFESEKFERACVRNGLGDEDIKGGILKRIPNDINENDKAGFLNWLISFFIKSSLKDGEDSSFWFEPSHIIKANAELFYQIKQQNLGNLLSKQDINQIETFKEFISIVEDANIKYQEHLQKKDYNDSSKGSNKIYEDSDWEVYIPESKGASCALGKGTNWCTAAPGLEYYEQYHSKGDPLIIFISKKDPVEKYQFHYKTEQFMDRKDQSITEEFIFFKLNDIVKTLKDKLPDSIIKVAKKYEYELIGDVGYKVGNTRTIQTFNNDNELESFDDQPAIIYKNGRKQWYKNGLIHRDNDQPAIIYENGAIAWYKNGKLHRDDDQPAVMDMSGGKTWYKNGVLHRDNDQPAIIYADGREFWYKNGKQHFPNNLKESKIKITFKGYL